MKLSGSLRLLGAVACITASFAAAAAIQLTPVASGLSSPVFVGNAHDGTNRLFIVEQGGTIRVLQPGAGTPTLFLDIHGSVQSGGEQGLLGLAFHPGYASNGRFFVYYTRPPDGAIVISEFHVSGNPNVAAPGETVLLTIPHPTNQNHNGGMLAFGPDGYLYAGAGDGGSGNDPPNNAQNLQVLLGKILRIDVDHADVGAGTPYAIPPDNPFVAGGGRKEIYAYGMRNPWRFSFDRVSGNMWVADVGQGALEEVDTPIVKGGNYGWRIWEANSCTGLGPASCTPTSNYIFPIFQYDHTAGRCSITGGYVYRGAQATLPSGTYVFGDYCTGEIFAWNGSAPTVLLDTTSNISAFGEDEQGELYVVALGGSVSKIGSSTPVLVNGDFETPSLPGTFAYHPTGAGVGWTFLRAAGIQGNGSAWNAAPAPSGTQTAVLQRQGSASQTVNLDAGSYTLTFQAARRSISSPAGTVQPVRVSVDGQAIGTLVSPSATTFSTFAIPFTVATSGAHTLAFAATDASGDKSTFIDAVSIGVAATPVAQFANPGFEFPPVGNGFQYAPSAPGLGWSFAGTAGVQGNGSAFQAPPQPAPVGTQAAFLQQAGRMWQTVTLPAGTYTLTFRAAQRQYNLPVDDQQYEQPIAISVDGEPIMTVTPLLSNSFDSYSVQFSVTADGGHTIEFAGTDPRGDRTAFIDDVALVAEPPSSEVPRNGSFETPAMGTGYQYAPRGPSVAWTFAGRGGIQANGSAWAGSAAPAGSQTAFLQQTGTMSQSVRLDAGNYTLSFQAARRTFSIPDGSVQPVRVTIDGQQIGSLVTPASTAFGTVSIPFSIGRSGAHTLQFAATDPTGDKTTLIDAISITSGP